MPVEYPFVVAYRMTIEDKCRMDALKETFPGGGWRDVFEWVFDLPGVRDAMNERIGSK